jgi:hypothetical protein
MELRQNATIIRRANERAFAERKPTNGDPMRSSAAEGLASPAEKSVRVARVDHGQDQSSVIISTDK